jgi:hypothetical protein
MRLKRGKGYVQTAYMTPTSTVGEFKYEKYSRPWESRMRTIEIPYVFKLPTKINYFSTPNRTTS